MTTMHQPIKMTVWVWLLLAAALTAGKVRITKADLIVAKQMLKPNVPASNGRWPMTRTVLMPMEKQSADNSYALPPQGYSIAPAGAPPMPMPMPMMPQYDSQPIMPPASPSSGYGSAPPPPPPSPPVTSYGTPVQTSGYGAAPAAGYGPAPPVYYEEEEEDCEKESKLSKLTGKMQKAVKGQKDALKALKEMVKTAAGVQKDMLKSFKEQLKEIKKPQQVEEEEEEPYYPAPSYGSAPAPSSYGPAPMPPMPVPYPVMQQPSYISTPTAPAVPSYGGGDSSAPAYGK